MMFKINENRKIFRNMSRKQSQKISFSDCLSIEFTLKSFTSMLELLLKQKISLMLLIFWVNNFYRNMELQTTNSNIKLDSVRQSKKSTRFKSKRMVDSRRNGQRRQKTIVQIRKDLYQKFQQFSIAQSFAKIYNIFRKTIGRNSVINYLDEYNFKQQWQFSNREENKQEYPISNFYGFLNFLILITLNLCIWGVSVKTFYQIQNSEWMYYVVVLVCVVKILKNIPRIKQVGLKLKMRMVYQEILCIVISLSLSVTETIKTELKLFSVIVIILLYLKASKVYQHIKIFYLSSKHREIADIIDLFVLLISIAHIFALLLYATTLLDYPFNWMQKISIQNESWSIKYLYSIYFSCTTMLTVGYGDISPTNPAQILTILLTQLIGIATNAYAVNKIGIAMSNITQRTQKLQKNLGNVEYIGNQYRLKPQLICRMRTQLIKEKNINQQLNINQENELFTKFSEDLREQIEQQRSMRVIKRSMFMIGNWTGKLQFKIARKLIKQIYAIDESLPQQLGRQKLYILDRGRIDVINNSRSGFKRCFQKILKTLTVSQNTEVVVENVYGYSAVVSERQIRLNAVAKQNSICYSLLKSDLFELLAQSEQDLQFYHQLKSKIDLSKIPQQIEAPSIINFRQHYCPSILYIITQEFNKQNINNKRRRVLRKGRRINLTILEESSIRATVHDKKQKQKYNNYNHNKNQPISGVLKIQDSWSFKSKNNLQDLKNQPFSELEIFGFQSCKQYQRYFKKSNFDIVLNRMKKRIYTGKFYSNRREIKKQNTQ